MDFLIEEAQLLDADQLDEWMALLTDDIFYSMPTRQTLARKSGRGFDAKMAFFYENMDSLRFRIRRLMHSENAYAEDPPSRVRRLITNVRVHETARADELLATSSVLALRNRGSSATYELLCASREDVLRRADAGFRIAQRTIYVEQATPRLAEPRQNGRRFCRQRNASRTGAAKWLYANSAPSPKRLCTAYPRKMGSAP
jgi:3-phenylpropionate/cinnamic acid dioxygenase small subunit